MAHIGGFFMGLKKSHHSLVNKAINNIIAVMLVVLVLNMHYKPYNGLQINMLDVGQMFLFVENSSFPAVFHRSIFVENGCGKLPSPSFQRGEIQQMDFLPAVKSKFLGLTFFQKKGAKAHNSPDFRKDSRGTIHHV